MEETWGDYRVREQRLKLGLPNSKGRDMQCGGEAWLPGVPSGSVFPDEVIGANPFTSVT